MDGWNLIVGWALVSIAAIVAGLVLLQKRRGYPGGSLLATGVFILLAPAAFVAYSISPLSDPTTIQVEGLDPPNDPQLTVALRHSRFFDDGTEVTFASAGDPERVAAVFQDQHPDGVVTTADPVPLSQGTESIWHLSTDEVRYELVYDPLGGAYGLATQVVVIHRADDGHDVRIPFPRSAFNVKTVDEGEPYANEWTVEQWADFYEGITLADVNADTITVPTNRGGTATITLDQSSATVTVNPQPR